MTAPSIRAMSHEVRTLLGLANSNANLTTLGERQANQNTSASRFGQYVQRTVKRNESIYQKGDRSKAIYVVQQGRVKIEADSEDGKKIIKSVLHEGEVFGELLLFGEESRKENAYAMEQSTICIVPIAIVKELMNTNRDFSNKILQLVGLRLLRAQRRLESLVFKDAQSRIVEFLFELANERGQKVGYEIVVRKFFTHQEIASFTNTSRQTVTTTLNKLRQDNLIYFDRRRLLVRDMDQLAGLII